MAVDDIFAINGLTKLEAHLRKGNLDRTRAALQRKLFALVEYRNARDWNQLVRVCEALAIVGWGDVEPIDARAEKWLNGAFYTELQNLYFEKRFLSAGWKKKGGTFVLDEASRFYHASPERAAHAEMDTNVYARAHPEVDVKDYRVARLATQRNPLPKNPVRFVRSGNFFPIFEPFIAELETLRARIDRETRPSEYGTGFGYMGIRCDFANEFAEYFHDVADVPKSFKGSSFVRPRIAFGRLAKKQGELRIVNVRHFPSEFTEQSLARQKKVFSQDLAEMVTDLGSRLKKKKVKLDVAALLGDVRKITDTW